MEWLNTFCRRMRAVTLVSNLRFQCAFLWMPRKNARRARPILFPKCLLLVSLLFVWVTCFNWSLSVYIRITTLRTCAPDISDLVLKCSLQFWWPDILPSFPEIVSPDQAGNALTFGAKMNMAKLRTCVNIDIIWRLRTVNMEMGWIDFQHNKLTIHPIRC